MGLAKMLQWVDAELSNDRNDTVHDLLAHLAEEMTEMNKIKNEEIKGFMSWLEREIGVEIKNLANKTAIKNYHEHDFDHLLDILKKNKGKISINLSARDIHQILEEEFLKSMNKLAPLKVKIQATDELIDEVVYKLYGLSKEEINIVKGEKEM